MTNLLQRFVDFATGEVTADVNNSKVTTDNLAVNSEPLVDVEMNNDQSISSGSFVAVDYDSEQKDVTDDYDISNNQFSPPETGFYHISLSVRFAVGSDSDSLIIRFQNTTDSISVADCLENAGGTSSEVLSVDATRKLDSSKTYQPQARNTNSSDTLEGFGQSTNLQISRVVLA